MTGASLIASGRVPKTKRQRMRAVMSNIKYQIADIKTGAGRFDI
jgi:hypothetical protein